MGWDRQPSETIVAPSALSPARWLAALAITGLAGVSLFLLHASQRIAALQGLNIWLFSFFPLLVVVMAFAFRAFRYGGMLRHHSFLESEAQAAQRSWEQWTGRYLAVHDCCVLLPEQVSAAVLAKGGKDLPLLTGLARRLAILPNDPFERIQVSLVRVLDAMQPSIQNLAAGSRLRITLLSDTQASRHGEIADTFRRVWFSVMDGDLKVPLVQVQALSLAWIEEKIRKRDTSLELILILQTEGEEDYSDALAALLVGLDVFSGPDDLPVKARLLRPMPLDITDLVAETTGLMQSQVAARSATGLLADVAQWQDASATMLGTSQTLGTSLQVEQQWIQEHFTGMPGPFGCWLVLALGVELVQHRREALLVLGKDERRQWVSTINLHEDVV